MFNLDPAKLLIIAVVAVILLGPDKLPQFARQVGGAWKSLNEFRHRMEADVRGHMPDLPSSAEIAHLARSPTALLNRLSNMGEGDGADGAVETAASANGANGTVSGAAANGTDVSHLPDGAPLPPFTPGPPPPATPAPSTDPSDVVIAGDPNLN